jgi:hypothetical protein
VLLWILNAELSIDGWFSAIGTEFLLTSVMVLDAEVDQLGTFPKFSACGLETSFPWRPVPDRVIGAIAPPASLVIVSAANCLPALSGVNTIGTTHFWPGAIGSWHGFAEASANCVGSYESTAVIVRPVIVTGAGAFRETRNVTLRGLLGAPAGGSTTSLPKFSLRGAALSVEVDCADAAIAKANSAKKLMADALMKTGMRVRFAKEFFVSLLEGAITSTPRQLF